LKKYENEYIEIHRIERDRIEEVEGLRSSNGQLTLQVRRLETSLAALNQEHIQVANEMVQGKLEIARLQDENENLTGELAELKKLTEETADLADATLREQMTAMEAENAQLTETNAKLQEQVGSLESELVDVKMKLATLDGSHSQLRSRWDDLRKHFEGTNIS
jgi:chromosome segregation ATPase